MKNGIHSALLHEFVKYDILQLLRRVNHETLGTKTLSGLVA